MSEENLFKSPEELIDELYGIIGEQFPYSLKVTSEGGVTSFEYETEWVEGGTVAVEKQDEQGNTFIDYEENYTTKKLTAAQIKLIDKWANDNIES